MENGRDQKHEFLGTHCALVDVVIKFVREIGVFDKVSVVFKVVRGNVYSF